ncbi:MAG: A/G-specific adenine glycosylase [Burkholderiaceae bacterium]|nr:MAG: A/G-specific adenine glycosylase [Burkholderiaceae bacterium]
MASGAAAGIAAAVLRWQRRHGRRGLPWQDTRDPYRVWLSEIMLQQTQVATVLDYFPRFLQRFPDVHSLARAELDEVLALWSGLGYYSRARNMHRCAVEIVTRHGGPFPETAAALVGLPGIGRSTAAAIAAFCFGERVAILDGNVRRVLTRVLGFSGDLAQAANGRALWDLATSLLPRRALADTMPRYTQGLMDIGAGICTPRAPRCTDCPLRKTCVAFREGEPERYPCSTRKLRRGAESLWLLQASGLDGAVWLEKRPARGIWAGLYCLPAFDSREALLGQLQGTLPAGSRPRLHEPAPSVHPLTHKDLLLHPVRVRLEAALPGRAGAWFAADAWPALGLPAPIRKLLASG